MPLRFFLQNKFLELIKLVLFLFKVLFYLIYFTLDGLNGPIGPRGLHILGTYGGVAALGTGFIVRALFFNLFGPTIITISLYEKALNLLPSLITK